MYYFFKKIFQPFLKYQEDEIFILYKKLRKWSSENQTDKIKSFLAYGKYSSHPNKMLDDCLEASVHHGDLLLAKELHSYISARNKKFNYGYKHADVFKYASIAMKANRIDIFEYFVEFYGNLGLNILPRFGEPKALDLVDEIIKHERVDYFRLLDKHNLLSCHSYLESYVSGEGSTTDDLNLKRTNFILKHFGNSLEKNILLIEACRNKKPNKAIIETLVNHGSNVSAVGGHALYAVGTKGLIDIVKYLVENGANKDPIFNTVATECARFKGNFEVVKYLVQQGAVIDTVKHTIEPEIHSWVKKWNDAKSLHDDLTSTLESPINASPMKKQTKI